MDIEENISDGEQSSGNDNKLGQLIFTILFFVGVMSCYWGAITGALWIGPIVVGLIGVSRIAISKNRTMDLKVILLVGGIGLAVETLLILFGIYTPDYSKSIILVWPILPEWMLALWLNFGFRVKDLLPMMRNKIISTSITGFVFGIIIFKSAEARELLNLNFGIFSLLIIAILWAVAVTLMFYFADKICLKRSENE